MIQDIQYTPEKKYLNNLILIFDSSIGGLTILQRTRFLMPEYNFFYVADDAGFPYGNQKDHVLKKRIISLLTKILDEYKPVLSIIACNTAFTLVGKELREIFPSMIFVGTVPAIKPAAEYTATGLVSVLSTAATLKHSYTQNLIHSFASQCHIQLVFSKNLASIAEKYVFGKDVCEDEIKNEINDCFVEKGDRRTDIVVLACTHYPFMTHIFRKVSPWPVDWLDPADSIARRARSLLPQIEKNQTVLSDDFAIFTSGTPDISMKRLMQGFGLKS
ncbi:glutamate racemase [Candidatus Liberibacter sp.]|uniref:glutamate racemase n=1 Tax=Candidatus Liberibacter sp. TaxID=34022 RepID=UPI00286FE64C|nr:glutamate racemase [Candidatus Liberibacter sp.]